MTDAIDAATANISSPQTRTAPTRTLAAIVRTARPKQWAKNILVFAAPIAAGVLFVPAVMQRTAIAFVAFCIVASGTYFINDAIDAAADRAHPTKRHRPIAAGDLSTRLAIGIGVTLIVFGIGLSVPVQNGRLALLLAAYVGITLAYTLGLKRQPVIELALVASGFVLRAIGGAIAANVAVSTWFLIVAGGGSLFIVAGKRAAELLQLHNAPDGPHRVVLDQYTPGFLRQVRTISVTVAVTAYCLWAFERAADAGTRAWFEISIVPFTLALLRYALIAERGEGGAPEDVLLRDRTLLGLGVVWCGCFAAGVFLG